MSHQIKISSYKSIKELFLVFLMLQTIKYKIIWKQKNVKIDFS